MARKAAAVAEQVEQQPADPLETIETRVAELERLRKTDAGSFYSNLGRREFGANYRATEELSSRLRGWVARLERLK